jgi:hypothetical protein
MNNDSQEGRLSGKKGIEEALKRLNAKMVYAEMEPMELVKLKQVLDRIGHEKLAERLQD